MINIIPISDEQARLLAEDELYFERLLFRQLSEAFEAEASRVADEITNGEGSGRPVGILGEQRKVGSD